jgi:hypothetical protein
MNTVGDGSNGYPISRMRLYKEWVSLTDEEIIATQLDLWITTNDVGNYDFDLRDFARNIEAKLKEKNG